MKNSFLGYILAAILLTPFPAGAYEFLCGGYTVTGYDNSGCPQGEYDNGGNCGCSVNTAPKWQGGLLNMVVENQGNNTVSASQFVDIAQYAANAWSKSLVPRHLEYFWYDSGYKQRDLGHRLQSGLLYGDRATGMDPGHRLGRRWYLGCDLVALRWLELQQPFVLRFRYYHQWI